MSPISGRRNGDRRSRHGSRRSLHRDRPPRISPANLVTQLVIAGMARRAKRVRARARLRVQRLARAVSHVHAGKVHEEMVQCVTWLGCSAFASCMACCLLRESWLCLDRVASDSSQPEIPAHGLPAEHPLVSTDDVKACSSMIFR